MCIIALSIVYCRESTPEKRVPWLTDILYYIYTHIYMPFTYRHTHAYSHVCLQRPTHTHRHIYIPVSTREHTYMFIHIQTHTQTHVHTYVPMHACTVKYMSTPRGILVNNSTVTYMSTPRGILVNNTRKELWLKGTDDLKATLAKCHKSCAAPLWL